MNNRSSMAVIFGVVFIDLLGFGIVIPILPYYAQEYGASGWVLGWLMTSYSLMQFFFAPLWGRISDQVGRRPVLMLSILGTALSLLLLGFAPSLLWLFVGRLFAGICGANISTAYAYVSDVTTEENRAKGMGVVGAAFGLGFIFGPAIGGVLSRYGYNVPMFFAAALAAVNLIFAWFKLPEPNLTARERSSHRFRRFDLSQIRAGLESPRSRYAILQFLLLTLAVTQMEVIFAIYMKAKFSYDAQKAGMLLGLTGLVMVSMQGGLIGRLAKKYGESKLVIVGTALCSVALFAYASSQQISSVILSLIVLALGHGMLHPSLSSLASKGAAPGRSGAVLGVFQSAGSLARVLGPLLAGWFYDHVQPNAPLYMGAGILTVGWIGSLLYHEPAPSAVGVASAGSAS